MMIPYAEFGIADRVEPLSKQRAESWVKVQHRQAEREI